LECVKPEGGVVCFPRVKQELNIDIALFYTILYSKFKTLVGPGHWFEMDERYMRIGYGWPETKALKEGLNCISLSLKEAAQ
ncbi:MAG: aspartate aminotransferase, partial [Bacteroidetes bacterium]|nr:aspartate aminotransferase [Bacteroidota bacterium]